MNEQFPHIVSDEVILRKIVASDLDNLYAIYSNEELFQYSEKEQKYGCEYDRAF